jgi:glycosyltransferase involved in cell wall biosynthesis
LARLICHFPALICTAHNLRETSEKGGATWHKELLYRATDGLANRTTIICRAAYDRYLQVRAVPAGKFQVIPNGVDTEFFAPSSDARAAARAELKLDGSFVWLTIGRLVQQKDYPTMFQAFARLRGSNSVLLIAGGGPLEAQLREQSSRLGLTERVRFCGTNENILPLFHAADAFVLSSEFEGLSAALLEASSMGLPAVVTDVGGNAEIVLNGVTGYRVPPHNARLLADAMEQLETLPSGERQLFSHSARQYCWANYRMQAVLRSWTDLYLTYSRPAASQQLALATAGAASQVNA